MPENAIADLKTYLASYQLAVLTVLIQIRDGGGSDEAEAMRRAALTISRAKEWVQYQMLP